MLKNILSANVPCLAFAHKTLHHLLCRKQNCDSTSNHQQQQTSPELGPPEFYWTMDFYLNFVVYASQTHMCITNIGGKQPSLCGQRSRGFREHALFSCIKKPDDRGVQDGGSPMTLLLLRPMLGTSCFHIPVTLEPMWGPTYHPCLLAECILHFCFVVITGGRVCRRRVPQRGATRACCKCVPQRRAAKACPRLWND